MLEPSRVYLVAGFPFPARNILRRMLSQKSGEIQDSQTFL